MTIFFDRKTYFDLVRADPFRNAMNQDQVDGQEFILGRWEIAGEGLDLRWLAYMLATTFHETAATMQPIEEYGKGSGKSYGVPDKETGQTYYGRGYVQLTWRDNYAKADKQLGFTKDTGMEWHASRALDPEIASMVLYRGMTEGWFRSDDKGRQTLKRYFSNTKDDAVGARDIINGDVSTMGPKVAGYHNAFLDALLTAQEAAAAPEVPVPPQAVEGFDGVLVSLQTPPGVAIRVVVNGVPMVEHRGEIDF